MMKIDDENRKIKLNVVNSLRRSDAVMTVSGLAALLSSTLTGCVPEIPQELISAIVGGPLNSQMGLLMQTVGSSSVSPSNVLDYTTNTASQPVSDGSYLDITSTPGSVASASGSGEGSVSLPFLEAAVTALNNSLELDTSSQFVYSELSNYYTYSFSTKEGFHDLFLLAKDSTGHTMYFKSQDNDDEPLLVYDTGSKMLIALINNNDGDLAAISGYVDVDVDGDGDGEVVPMYDGVGVLVVQLDEEDAILFSAPSWDATIAVERNVSSEAYDIYTRTSALEYFGGDKGSESFTLDSNYSYYFSEVNDQGEATSYHGLLPDGTVDSEIGESTAEEYIQAMFEDSTSAELMMMSVTDLKKDGQDLFTLVEAEETAQAELLLISFLTSDSNSGLLMSGKSLAVIYDYGYESQDASFLKEEAYIIDSGFSKDDTGQYQLEILLEENASFKPSGIFFGLDELVVNADVFNEMFE